MRKVKSLSDLHRFREAGHAVTDGDGIDVGLPDKVAPAETPKPDLTAEAFDRFALTLAGLVSTGQENSKAIALALAELRASVLVQKPPRVVVEAAKPHGWTFDIERDDDGKAVRLIATPTD